MKYVYSDYAIRDWKFCFSFSTGWNKGMYE